MIFIHADDYGVSDSSADTILNCINAGSVRSVSVRANVVGLEKYAALLKKRAVRVGVHLDLVEGRCVAPKEKVFLLADSDGYFRHGFVSLWLKYIFASKKVKMELKKHVALEFQAQTENLKKHINFSAVDTHCHTHMIPFIFDVCADIARKENAVLRIPCEPSLPFIKHVSLWLTYKPANILKHFLLNVLGMRKQCALKRQCRFFGVMFSGKMDLARVKKILPEMAALAENNGEDLEVLFHPCAASADERIDTKNKKFENYYKAPERVLEKETVLSDFIKNVSGV
jgi:predicted glycoside hydrolase/deacetylase ChbG (UPF0249 family)